MAQCVVIDEAGALHASVADPCTTLVLLTPAEYGAFAASPFLLDAADGGLIAAAVSGCWLLAFAYRAVRQTLNGDGEGEGS